MKRSKFGFVARSMAAGALSLLAGCEGTATEPGPAGTTQGAGVTPSVTVEAAVGGDVAKATDFFEKTTSRGDKVVASPGGYMCALSMVTGNFEGDDELNNAGQTYIDWEWEGYYRFWWRPGWTNARALCTNWNNFLIGAGGEKRYSGQGWAEAYGYSTQTADVAMFPGDWITFVQGMIGELQGGGEYVRAIQSKTLTGNSTVRAHEEDGSALDWTFLRGFGQSFRIGKPGAKLIRLRGYDSAGNAAGNAASSGTFEFPVSTVSGYSGYWMTTVNDGFCGFTKLSGNFDGGGEILRISKSSDGWWYLSASSTGGKAISANARCVAYDQR